MNAREPIPITIVLGPTAVGKSAVAFEAAQRSGAEIISADSMQIYRGMDLGTAKPSSEHRSAVPHHLIDVCDPADAFNVADFVRLADQAAGEIFARGRPVLMVGGTALYLKGFMEGIFEGPGDNPEVRDRLRQESETSGVHVLYGRLRGVDPEAASRIHANDERRIIRALEVWELTGRPISAQQTQEGGQRREYAFRLVGLRMPRDLLYERINDRVVRMVEGGLVEETRALLGGPRGLGSGARQALGYREVIAHLEGELDLDTAVHFAQQGTRRFAKRQTSWFKRFPDTEWLDLDGSGASETAAAERLHGFLA